jgi:hypothetical protein
MSSLVHYEAFADDCADLFLTKLAGFADREESLNLGHWFQCYAFDVIGNITFGERFGKFSNDERWKEFNKATQGFWMMDTI